MNNFKAGDIVQLKSGGPEMTVKDPKYIGDSVLCQWFGATKLHNGSFSPESLIKVERAEGEAK